MEGPPPAKRAKTNARTIAEHARKYPCRPSPPVRPPPDCEVLGDAENLLWQRAQTPPKPPRSPFQPPSPFGGDRGNSPGPPIPPPADWDQEQEDDNDDDLDMEVHAGVLNRPDFSKLKTPAQARFATLFEHQLPTKEGNYSVGACYLVLNNLPRHLRFLRKNICLAIVMPGPGEPNSYALEQILGPPIDDLLELRQGVQMTIREGNPPVYRKQFVHVHLTQHIADLIARIKMGGGAGLRSESNFCLHCHTCLSSLSVPAGFKREDFDFRDPQEELSNAYFWRLLDNPKDQVAFFDFTGNRFTAMHQLNI